MSTLGQRVTPAVDWLFRSRTDAHITIVQWPNLALAIDITCDVARWALHTRGALDETLHWVGAAALTWWSLDEIIRGVNPFRRLLGAVVLVGLIVGILRPSAPLG